MKIIVFAPYYPPHVGGLEQYAHQLNQQFARQGLEITVFTPRLPRSAAARSARKSGISIIRFPAFELIPNYPLPQFWRPAFWRQYLALYRRRFDFVISHTRFFSTSLLAWEFSRLKKIKWIHIEHGSDHSQLNNPLTSRLARLYDYTLSRLVLKSADQVVTISRAAQKFVKKIAGVRAQTIYRGFDAARFKKIPPARFASISRPRVNLIFIGRLIDGKGLPDLIKALSHIKDQPFACRLIGDGSQQARIRRLIAASPVRTKIKLLGFRNHERTIALLKASDILINPSYTEGLPTSLVEAALCRKAIIATAVGGTPEIIKDQQSGLLFTPGDTIALTQKLELLIQDAVLRDKLAQAALAQNRHKFRWSQCVQEFQALFQKLAAK